MISLNPPTTVLLLKSWLSVNHKIKFINRWETQLLVFNWIAMELMRLFAIPYKFLHEIVILISPGYVLKGMELIGTCVQVKCCAKVESLKLINKPIIF